jgi:hypothetical protein
VCGNFQWNKKIIDYLFIQLFKILQYDKEIISLYRFGNAPRIHCFTWATLLPAQG